MVIKMYDKGERVLRIEVVCHNIGERYKNLRRSVDNFPMIIKELRQILEAFINALYFSHVAFIDKGEFDQLNQPSKKGQHRLAGINLDKPGCRNVMKAVLELSTKPDGFTSKAVAEKYAQIAEIPDQSYKPRHAAYDLRKLTAKELVERKENSRKYHITSKGISMIVATAIIRDKIFKPIVAAIGKECKVEPSEKLSKVDQIYISIRDQIRELCKYYGVVGVIM